MIMGAFIPGLRRKYPVHEYISAFLLVLGLILFTLADAQMSPNFSMIGIMMITGALIMDAFLGNLQEAIFTMNPETTQARIRKKKTRFFSVFLYRSVLFRVWDSCNVFVQMEMLFCSTVVGLPFLFVPMVLTGEVFRAWTACAQVSKQPLFSFFLVWVLVSL